MTLTAQDILLFIYLIVNLVVFFIQREEIKKLKSIVSSIKDYVAIIDIKKLKEYVEVREETIAHKSANILLDDEKVQKIMDSSIDSTIDKLTEIYLKQIKEQHIELISFTVEILKQIDETKQNQIIEAKFPLCKDFLTTIMEEENSSKS
jgi:hypothetical protein